MAHDSEVRLKKVMDKLYRAPRPRISALSRPGGGGVITSKGILVQALAPREQVRKALPCRPWNRGDLVRRLATFKAMTWFGKPKDISPVNCARRGWINVEMDIIVCEACGARLLFSTPPLWSLQQVEKAAAVFSLKLNNGHKLLCPWINNECDESLASFPPSPPQALVEGFKERSHALWCLTTLPAISSLVIDYMKGPQLDRFLSKPVHPSLILNNGVKLVDDCRSMDEVGAIEGDNAHGYYQALNIISLCGWEPRLLPYIIDFEGRFGPCTKAAKSLESLNEIPGEIQNLAGSSKSYIDVEGRKETYSGEFLCDQSSTVLECRFCGACVGLWCFKSIPRPLEFFKIIIDDVRQSGLSTVTADLAHGVEVPVVENFGRDYTSNIEKPSGLCLSIAGGPPPNKQQFRPIVSFPIVSRHLRSELLYNSYLRHQQDTSWKGDHFCLQKEFNDHHDEGSQAGLSLKHKQCELEGCNSQLHAGGNNCDVGDSLAAQGRIESTTEEIPSPCTDIVVRDAVGSQSDSPTTAARESNDSVLRLDQSDGYNSQHHGDMGDILAGKERSERTTEEIYTPHTKVVVRDAVPCQSNAPITDVRDSYGEGRSEILSPCTDIVVRDAIPSPSGSPTTDARESTEQASVSNGFAKEAYVSATREGTVDHLSGNLRPTPVPDLDPIKQHRPFCPWISEGKNLPGWKAVLSALNNLESNTSQLPEQAAADSNLLDETDDPIVCVRNLFMRPLSKKRKGSQQSTVMKGLGM